LTDVKPNLFQVFKSKQSALVRMNPLAMVPLAIKIITTEQACLQTFIDFYKLLCPFQVKCLSNGNISFLKPSLT